MNLKKLLTLTLAATGLVLAAAAADTAPAADAPETMKSSKLEVRFDAATQEPAELLNVETGEKLQLRPESSFRFEFYRMGGTMSNLVAEVHAKKAELLVVDATNCTLAGVTQKPGRDEILGDVVKREAVYDSEHGRVTVTYTLGPDDHFIEKEARFAPSFPEPYLLWQAAVRKYQTVTQPKKEVQYAHLQCMTRFVRLEKGGFMTGIETIFTGNNDQSYNVKFRFPGKHTYVAEKVYWGCYRLSGIMSPETPPEERLDVAESEAMVAMARRLAYPARPGIYVTVNGWCSGVGMPPANGGSLYGQGADPKGLERDKQNITVCRKNYGEFLVTLGDCWGGLSRDIAKLLPSDTKPPEAPLAAELLEWAKSQNVGITMGTCHGGPMPWANLHTYCPSNRDWQGTGLWTCPANREFFGWYTNLLFRMIRRGYASFNEDELSIMGGNLESVSTGPCVSKTHDHWPGGGTYGWWYLRKELYRALHREFGSGFPIQCCRPSQDMGIWEWVLLNHVFTVNEGPPPGGNRVRLWSRVRHFHHFCPSYMDQALVNAFTDYDMLSALAVSSTYLFYGKGNETTRKWLDWARAHPEHMQAQAIFLPDWPKIEAPPKGPVKCWPKVEAGSVKCDGYLRLVNGAGFAFLFNSGDVESDMELPLDASVGLDAAKTYELVQIYPEPKEPAPKSTAKAKWTAKIPPGGARLIELKPQEGGK